MSTATAAVPGAITIEQAARLQVGLLEDALRPLKSRSGLADCLVPLLEGLSWRGDPRQLMEALPHFADDLDLTGLRNVLAAVGYSTRPVRTRLRDADARLAPFLFTPERGAPLVVLERDGDRFRVFDSHHGGERILDRPPLRGVAFVVQRATSDERAETRPSADWIGDIGTRFRRLAFGMMALTGVLDVISITVPLFTMVVYDKVIGARSHDMLVMLCIGLAVLLCVDVVLRTIRARALAHIGARFDHIVGTAVLRQILMLPPAFTELAPVGAQISRLKDFESIREFFTGPFAAVLLDLPYTLLFILVIAILAGPLVWIAAAMVAVFVLLALLMLPVMRRLAAEASRARSRRHGFTVEMLSHIRAIKQGAGERTWFERFRDLSARSAHAQYRSAQVAFLLHTLSHVIMLGAGVATLGMGALRVTAGDMTIGALVATMALTWRVLSPLQVAFVAMPRIENIRASIAQINRLMRLKPERAEGGSFGGRRHFRGALSLSRISMRYRSDGEPAVIGFSLDAAPGEIVAIAGPNGSGKSSVLKLAAGMYQPQAGAVMIDGLDIRQIDPITLRQTIGYLPQSCHLFHGTVAQNLRLAEPTASDAALRSAAEQAGVLAEIEALPDGFETRIGDQRLKQLPSSLVQRLALARIYLKESNVLLLDEPGQSLDEAGDQAFMDMLQRFRGRRTVLMVTHRPSHMRLADRLVVIDSGRVVLEGPPAQVMSRIPKGFI